MSNEQSTEIAEAVALGAAAASREALKHIHGPAIVTPSGYKVTCLEKFQETPNRATGTVTLNTVADLAEFLAVQDSTDEHCRAFFQTTGGTPKVSVFLNFHGNAENPDWCDYKAVLDFKLHWKHLNWRVLLNKSLTQKEFIRAIEDNLDDITEPKGADLLEMVRDFRATSNVVFETAQDSGNGNTRIIYEKKTSGAGKKNEMTVPDELTIAIPYWAAIPSLIQVRVRLSYEVEDGKLYSSMEPLRFAQLEEEAIESALAELRTALPCPVHYGQFLGTDQ